MATDVYYPNFSDTGVWTFVGPARGLKNVCSSGSTHNMIAIGDDGGSAYSSYAIISASLSDLTSVPISNITSISVSYKFQQTLGDTYSSSVCQYGEAINGAYSVAMITAGSFEPAVVEANSVSQSGTATLSGTIGSQGDLQIGLTTSNNSPGTTPYQGCKITIYNITFTYSVPVPVVSLSLVGVDTSSEYGRYTNNSTLGTVSYSISATNYPTAYYLLRDDSGIYADAAGQIDRTVYLTSTNWNTTRSFVGRADNSGGSGYSEAINVHCGATASVTQVSSTSVTITEGTSATVTLSGNAYGPSLSARVNNSNTGVSTATNSTTYATSGTTFTTTLSISSVSVGTSVYTITHLDPVYGVSSVTTITVTVTTDDSSITISATPLSVRIGTPSTVTIAYNGGGTFSDKYIVVWRGSDEYSISESDLPFNNSVVGVSTISSSNTFTVTCKEEGNYIIRVTANHTP